MGGDLVGDFGSRVGGNDHIAPAHVHLLGEYQHDYNSHRPHRALRRDGDSVARCAAARGDDR